MWLHPDFFSNFVQFANHQSDQKFHVDTYFEEQQNAYKALIAVHDSPFWTTLFLS